MLAEGEVEVNIASIAQSEVGGVADKYPLNCPLLGFDPDALAPTPCNPAF